MTTSNTPKRSRKPAQAQAQAQAEQAQQAQAQQPQAEQAGSDAIQAPQAEPQAPQAPQQPQAEPQAETVTVDGLDAPVSADLAIDAALTDNDAFDLAAFMAQGMETADDILTAKSAKSASSGGQVRQRVIWPKDAQDAASTAGVRLPGLFPKPGSASAKGAGGGGWYRNAGPGRPPGKNASLALNLLWRMIGAPLAAGQTLPTAALLGAAAVIQRTYSKSSATPPEWSLHLIAPTEPREDGSKVGLATSLLSQAAIMAGPVLMTPEAIKKV